MGQLGKSPVGVAYFFLLTLLLYRTSFFPLASGLWQVCLNGFQDMRLQYEVKFYGCKHILLEDYDIIRDEIQPRE